MMISEREINNGPEPEVREDVAASEEREADQIPAGLDALQPAIIYTTHEGFGGGRMLLIW